MTCISSLKQCRFCVPKKHVNMVLSHSAINVQTSIYGDITYSESQPSISFIYLHGLKSERRGEKSETLTNKLILDGNDRAFTRFDFRGHGESTENFDFEGDFTLSGALDDAVSVMEHALQAPQAVEASKHVLIGYSMGGLVATRVASLFPEKVSALVLLAPGFGLWDRTQKILMQASSGDTLEVNRLVIPSSYVPEGEIVLGNRFIQDAREQWGADAEQMSIDSIKSEGIPVLVVHGAEDDVIPYEFSQAFASETGAEFLLLDGENHRMNMSADRIAREIDRFCSERIHDSV